MKHKCNGCKESVCKSAGGTATSRYTLYCGHGEMMRMVDMSISPTAIVEAPSWCPLAKLQEKLSKVSKGETLTYQEKVDVLVKMSPRVAWDDIKENAVYHIPKLPGEERKDIVITRKSNFSCSFKVIGDKHENTIYTLYPNTLMSKFLVEHKIKQFVPINR